MDLSLLFGSMATWQHGSMANGVSVLRKTEKESTPMQNMSKIRPKPRERGKEANERGENRNRNGRWWNQGPKSRECEMTKGQNDGIVETDMGRDKKRSIVRRGGRLSRKAKIEKKARGLSEPCPEQ